MHPDFPHVRLGKAPVMKFFAINKDVLIMHGPQSGMYKAQFECIIEGCDGRACGTMKEIRHKDRRVISTTNLITHLRQLAPKCVKLFHALAEVEAASKNCIELNGETVVIMSFSEAFSHHVEFMYLRSSGMVSQKMTQLPEWRGYVRGFDARATFPHGVTARQLAETVAELQRLEFMERMSCKPEDLAARVAHLSAASAGDAHLLQVDRGHRRLLRRKLVLECEVAHGTLVQGLLGATAPAEWQQ